uniref:Protein kinase domain-containing protein n=1 Tax=Physcomitrium patens TaxID=3218 RepID=A0A2K1ILX7_PHYPA|nr:hypothetical protein PHYPA_026601 [Physcomitrium patens]
MDMDILKDMEILTTIKAMELELNNIEVMGDEQFNANQCKNLLENFKKGLQEIEAIVGAHVHKLQPILEDLSRIIVKVKKVIKNCLGDWRKVILMQRSSQETFRELLLELQWFYNIIYEIFDERRLCQKMEVEGCNKFEPCGLKDVAKDERLLFQKLNNIVENVSNNSNAFKLINYIVEWQSCIHKFECGAEEFMAFPTNFPEPDYKEYSQKLQESMGMVVYVTTWLDFESITKIISFGSIEAKNILEKEAHILSRLNHPNIIKVFYCASKIHSNHRGEIIIGMEKGDMSLSKLLYENHHLQMSFLHKVDVMIQIANAMFYLHDMKVAHRDLKPQNVVIMNLEMEEIKKTGYIHVKLIDFGISKVEVNGDEKPTNQRIYETTRYMAPEARYPLNQLNPFKADVFSFGILCCDILTSIENEWDYKDSSIYVKKRLESLYKFNHRLQLLIKECLDIKNPSKRPSFLEIVKSLMEVKKQFFEDELTKNEKMISNNISFTKNLKRKLQDWTINFCKKFAKYKHTNNNEMNNKYKNISKDSSNIYDSNISKYFHKMKKDSNLESKFVELEKLLLKNHMVGIVGMAGIGKSTLVKAFKEYIDKKLSNKSMFLPNKNNNTKEFSFENTTLLHGTILWNLKNDYLMELSKTLQFLDNKCKAMNLEEGKQILIKKLQEKRLLIIFDDVLKHEDMKKVVDIAMLGIPRSKFIVISREWNILKKFISESGKIELSPLDESTSMKILLENIFKDGPFYMPHLYEFSTEISKACDGHSLSLEFVGSSLKGQTRLRVWEQTLHRLKRANIYVDGEDLLARLKPSFDDLGEEEKIIFLDLTCFFCKDTWLEDIHEGEIFQFYEDKFKNCKKIITTLKDKLFIKVDIFGMVTIHDLLRDMGRKISRKNCNEIRKWNESCTLFVDFESKDNSNIRGICFTSCQSHLKPYGSIKIELPYLCLLSFMACTNTNMLTSIIKQSNQLKWLKLYFFGLENTIILKYDIEIVSHLIHENYLKNLVILEIIGLTSLTSFSFDATSMKFLKTLSLNYCFQLISLNICKEKYTILNTLNLRGCSKLKDVTNILSTIKTLTYLDLQNCEDMEKIGDKVHLASSLILIDLTNCLNLYKVNKQFANLVSLKKLLLKDCSNLKKIHATFDGMTNLKILWFEGCEMLEDMPIGLKHLSSLQELSLRSCKKMEIKDDTFNTLTSLNCLDLSGCIKVETIHYGFANLVFLERLFLKDCTNLKKIHATFDGMTNLKILWFEGCEMLEDMPIGLKHLSSLQKLSLRSCKKMEIEDDTFNALTSLIYLDLSGCIKVETIHYGFTNFVCLERLFLKDCTNLKKIHATFDAMTNLNLLTFEGCEKLEDMPLGFKHLSSF